MRYTRLSILLLVVSTAPVSLNTVVSDSVWLASQLPILSSSLSISSRNMKLVDLHDVQTQKCPRVLALAHISLYRVSVTSPHSM